MHAHMLQRWRCLICSDRACSCQQLESTYNGVSTILHLPCALPSMYMNAALIPLRFMISKDLKQPRAVLHRLCSIGCAPHAIYMPSTCHRIMLDVLCTHRTAYQPKQPQQQIVKWCRQQSTHSAHAVHQPPCAWLGSQLPFSAVTTLSMSRSSCTCAGRTTPAGTTRTLTLLQQPARQRASRLQQPHCCCCRCPAAVPLALAAAAPCTWQPALSACHQPGPAGQTWGPSPTAGVLLSRRCWRARSWRCCP